MDNNIIQYVRKCNNCKIIHDFYRSPLCMTCIRREERQNENVLASICAPDECRIHGAELKRNCIECQKAHQHMVSNRATNNTAGYIFFDEDNMWSN